MGSLEIDIVFGLFSPSLLGTLSLIAATLYLYRYYRHARDGSEIIASERRSIYFVRFLYWLLFSIAWYLFPTMPLLYGRAMLRAAIAFVILAEVLYNWSFIHWGAWGIEEIGHRALLKAVKALASDVFSEARNLVKKWTRK